MSDRIRIENGEFIVGALFMAELSILAHGENVYREVCRRAEGKFAGQENQWHEILEDILAKQPTIPATYEERYMRLNLVCRDLGHAVGRMIAGVVGFNIEIEAQMTRSFNAGIVEDTGHDIGAQKDGLYRYPYEAGLLVGNVINAILENKGAPEPVCEAIWTSFQLGMSEGALVTLNEKLRSAHDSSVSDFDGSKIVLLPGIKV